MAVLHAVPELRARVGAASRASVEKYQSFDAVAEVWTRIYRHIWWGEPLHLESTAPFDPTRTARLSAEDPAEAAFCPYRERFDAADRSGSQADSISVTRPPSARTSARNCTSPPPRTAA